MDIYFLSFAAWVSTVVHATFQILFSKRLAHCIYEVSDAAYIWNSYWIEWLLWLDKGNERIKE